MDAGGERYFIQVWLGRDAPARLRTVLVRMIGSIKFDPLRAGTTHGAVAVVQKASHYPDGSFTLLHIGGQVCAGGVETCQNASEPIYLIHAPGHFDLSNLPLDARCVPASSCLPFGSFYAIGWRDKTGYPSACDLRLDRRDEQFYCTNTRARWDLGGRPITIPNSGHDYPTALSFDVAKIAWDGRIIIGGSYTSEIPSSVVKALWPRLPPPR